MSTKNEKSLKTIREEAGLTQEKLAKETKLSIRYISLLENGKRNPSDKTKKILGRVLKVSPVVIFLIFNSTKSSTNKRKEKI